MLKTLTRGDLRPMARRDLEHIMDMAAGDATRPDTGPTPLLTQRYTLSFNLHQEPARRQFRLIDVAGNVPLHIEFRAGGFRVNAKHDNVWGRETQYAYPFALQAEARVQIDLTETGIVIRVGDEFVVRHRPAAPMLPVERVSGNCTMRVTPLAATAAEDGAEGGADPRICTLPFLNSRLRLPGFDADSLPVLSDALDLVERQYLRQLATLIVAPGALFVLACRFHPLEAVLMAHLFPKARILALAEGDAAALAEALALADLNGAAGVTFVPAAEAGAALAALSQEMAPELAQVIYLLPEVAAITALDSALPSEAAGGPARVFLSGLPEENPLPLLKSLLLHPGSAGRLSRGSGGQDLSWPVGGGRRPGIDVVVAMYNSEAFIADTIAALAANDMDVTRILVVDDGSKDNSAAIVRDLAATRPWLTLLQKENGGCASARNFGRIHSDASHIAFVDADDFMDPDFFSNMFYVALATGAETVQSEFDFHDITRANPYYDSYEQKLFAERKRSRILDLPTYRVTADELMIGQPSIWRRVYRRDFLDSRKIWFPESVRAFDDYYFQLLVLKHARDVHVCDGARYHYRQHPGQDIKQGDERHFYELYMFETLMQRAIQEGWNDFQHCLRSFANTTAWTARQLRGDLVGRYLEGLAEVVHGCARTFGDGMVQDYFLNHFQNPDFHFYYRRQCEALAGADAGYHWALVRSRLASPAVIQTIRKLSS